MTKPHNIVSISINHKVNAENLLYRLCRGTTLRIIPGPTLLGRRVALYCNLPVTGNLYIMEYSINNQGENFLNFFAYR